MKATNKVIRPTQAVRRLMQVHGAPSWGVYTNKFEKCRTVKCYASRVHLDSFFMDLKALYAELGYGKPQVKVIPSYSEYRDCASLIVRIPFSMQA